MNQTVLKYIGLASMALSLWVSFTFLVPLFTAGMWAHGIAVALMTLSVMFFVMFSLYGVVKPSASGRSILCKVGLHSWSAWEFGGVTERFEEWDIIPSKTMHRYYRQCEKCGNPGKVKRVTQ